MAFNDEDYLDKLLKSVTDGNAPSMQEDETEVYTEIVKEVTAESDESESVAQEPDTFEVPEVIEVEEETVNTLGIDESMSIDEFMSAMAMNSERYEDEAEVLETEDEEEITEEVIEVTEEQQEDYQSEEYLTDSADIESDDDLVDEYIKKVLSLDENFVPSEEEVADESDEEYAAEESFVENSDIVPDSAVEENHYVDITNEEFFGADDLINQLDSIISDSAMEMEAEQPAAPELQVDDELKDLLGMNEEQEESSYEEFTGLSEEDLLRIASIEEEVAKVETMPDTEEIAQEVEENETEELAELLGLLAENGIDIDANSDSKVSSDEIEVTDIKTDIEVSKRTPKESFLTKILSVFKKKEKTSSLSEDINENQKVLDELFDENGELLGDNKNKAKKKGLFSKPGKVSDSMVEISDSDFAGAELGEVDFASIPDMDEGNNAGKKAKKKKEKVKKDKPKKEKAPKKPKKASKPKVKKEKRPVAPHELITVKPRGVFFMLVVVAGICGVAYLLPGMFSYNQAFDTATYYLVDKKYTFAYEAIAGVEPTKDEDIALVEQIETIMMVQKQYNSYERYAKMNMQFEALDALIKGVGKYDEFINKAVEIGVGDDLENVRVLVVNALWQQYGITEDMARSYGLLTDYDQYAYILESYGGRIDDSNY